MAIVNNLMSFVTSQISWTLISELSEYLGMIAFALALIMVALAQLKKAHASAASFQQVFELHMKIKGLNINHRKQAHLLQEIRAA